MEFPISIAHRDPLITHSFLKRISLVPLDLPMQEHFLKTESDCPPLSLPADIALCVARPEVMARKIKDRNADLGQEKTGRQAAGERSGASGG
jgi:hypothetical protein